MTTLTIIETVEYRIEAENATPYPNLTLGLADKPR